MEADSLANPTGDVVVAVIVSYQRRETILQTLAALNAQSRPLDRIIVVDNASTDGSPEAIRTEFPEVDLVALSENTGGAGGFSLGMALAIASGGSYAWLMDDDVIPDSTALEELLVGLASYGHSRPALATCRVLGPDRRLGPRNWCYPSKSYPELVHAAQRGHLAIRRCSFVAPLIDLGVARETHLPLRDYFIWHDDTEYTARICKAGGGMMVPSSTVVHLAESPGPGRDLGDRLFYDIRNRIWIARNREVFSGSERADWWYATWAMVFGQARVTQNRWRYVKALTKALASGILTSPRREYAEAVAGRCGEFASFR